MDVGFFFKERIGFIQQFYDAAALPLIERKRKIEEGEAPFVPTGSESEEPPFLREWIEADDSLQVLGYACISMLAASFHLYFKTLENEFGVPVPESLKNEFKKGGWFKGYKEYFRVKFGVYFEKSPANLSVLEEVVLARNKFQHPESIGIQRLRYSAADIRLLHRPYFIEDREIKYLTDIEETETSWLFPPGIYITKEKLISAITEADKFREWLESQIKPDFYKQ